MALSSAVISFDIADLLGNDFNPAKTRVSVTTNVPDGVIADTVGNQIRVGDGTVQIGADGTGTVSVWIPGTGSNPASWQTYIHLDATPSRSGVGRVPKTFGPFTITADANLADLIQEQEIPPTYLSQVEGALQSFLDDAEDAVGEAEAAQAAAEAAAQDAVDISGISTSDAVVQALVKGTAGAGPLTRAALSATLAALVQWAKNPDSIVTGSVTVDTSDQIVSAAVVWPDGQPGTLTITSRDSNNGAVLAYNITYGSPVTKTFTQPAITRNVNGAATNVPAIVVS